VRAGGDDAIERICPDARNLLLIPENHTRNQFYLMNVARLAAILERTGLDVRIGTLIPEIAAPTKLDLPDGQALLLEPLVRLQRPPRPRRLRSLRHPAQQRPLRRRAGAPQGLHEQTSFRRCTPAGTCGASRATSPPTTASPATSPRPWASTPG
jgi:hypothetical protein